MTKQMLRFEVRTSASSVEPSLEFDSSFVIRIPPFRDYKRRMRLWLILAIVAAAAMQVPAEDRAFDRGRWSLELTSSYITAIRFSEDKFYNLTLGGGYYLLDGAGCRPDIGTRRRRLPRPLARAALR